MRCAIVTDELSSDPLTAFELGREWGVEHFELRGMHVGRVPALDEHALFRLRAGIAAFGVAITAISPGLFKFAHPDAAPERSNLEWMDRGFHSGWAEARAMLAHHLDTLLPASIAFAESVGAEFVIAFSFHRAFRPPGPAPSAVVDTLGRAAETARAAGRTLLVETEEGFWADTGARTAALMRAAGPALGVNWDPANSFCAGDSPFPEGYAHVAPWVRNVHFKDARRAPDGSARYVAEGEIDWQGQIAALARAGYAGFVGIEPHLSPSVASVRHGLERARALIATAQPQS